HTEERLLPNRIWINRFGGGNMPAADRVAIRERARRFRRTPGSRFRSLFTSCLDTADILDHMRRPMQPSTSPFTSLESIRAQRIKPLRLHLARHPVTAG
ncbi:MAG: hypothetical protein ACREF3_00260, partial [Acetobacteraceae bacterium]